MEMKEINRLFEMVASGDEEMQNLGIRAMWPNLKIPKDKEDKRKIINMLKSDLCIQAFNLGVDQGREIQQKITGQWQPYYRTTEVEKKED